MGLGGYLTWTAVARELKQRDPERPIVFTTSPSFWNRLRGRPHGAPIDSEVFAHNPHLTPAKDLRPSDDPRYVWLDDPQYRYHSLITREHVRFKSGGHIIELLCRQFDITHPRLQCELFLTEDERGKAADLTSGWSRFLTVEPHAKADFTANKGWAFERWQAVVEGLGRECRIVQVGVGGKPVLRGVTDMTGQLTFRQTAALIGRSALLLSTEGGLTHAANAVGTRAVVVYGGYQPPSPTAYPGNINLYADISCAPCGLRVPCPIGLQCMGLITPDHVIEAARTILAESRSRACETMASQTRIVIPPGERPGQERMLPREPVVLIRVRWRAAKPQPVAGRC